MPHRLQAGQRPIAAVGLADARQAGIGLQFHDGAQGKRRVPAVGTAQRGIGDGNRMQNEIGDQHGT